MQNYRMEWSGMDETSGDEAELFVGDLSLLSETLGGSRASGQGWTEAGAL